jgi:signal transduction histidine kinase
LGEAAVNPPEDSEPSGQVPRDVWTLRAIIETQNLINNAGLSLQETLDVVTERARALTSAGGAVVEMAEGEDMVYAAVSGTTSDSLGLRLKLNASLSGLAVTTGRILRCDDSEIDPRVDREACRRVGARSMVVAPLTHQGTSVGALKVLSDKRAAFDERHVGILEVLAGFIATALAHARTFEENDALLRETTRLNQALDAFSSHVAHDLRTPLAQVTMAVALLRETPAGPDADHLLDMIERQSARGAALVTELLELARASRSPRLESLVLAELATEAASSVDGLDLRIDCDATVVEADRVAVRQALFNLLNNAARHGSGDVTLSCSENDGFWRVAVADRGPGVSAEDRATLFDAFKRGSAAKAEGTGLGLAIVAATAAAHGGEAGVDDRPGGGAIFWFTLHRPG